MSRERFREINKDDIYISVSELEAWCDNFSHDFAGLRKALSVFENEQKVLNNPEAMEKVKNIIECTKILNEKKNSLSVNSGKIKANIELAGKVLKQETFITARDNCEEMMNEWREVARNEFI